MDVVFSDEMRISTWAVVESTLAQVQGELGMIPESAARRIAQCAQTAPFDVEAMAEQTKATAHSMMAFIWQFKDLCGPDGEYLHWGVTTQDIVDTAAMLQYQLALGHIGEALAILMSRCAALAERHAATPMAGRTHAQHAVPITFGLKVAGWLDELSRHGERYSQLIPRVLVGNLAGAAGSMSAMDGFGTEVQERVLQRLHLGIPTTSWHSSRDRAGEMSAWLGLLAGTLGRIANELYALQRTEVAEVFEGRNAADVGSSTMPQKNNPSRSEFAAAAAHLAIGQVSVGISAMVQENERDVRTWLVEWEVLPELFLLASGALDNLLAAFDGLYVDEARMRHNLMLTDGQILSEAAMMVLARAIGRQSAHEHVRDVSRRARANSRNLLVELAEDPLWIEHSHGESLLEDNVGESIVIVERALASADPCRAVVLAEAKALLAAIGGRSVAVAPRAVAVP